MTEFGLTHAETQQAASLQTFLQQILSLARITY
jgi:hypothetical protein